MKKKWAPIAAGVSLVVMLVICIVSIAESKRESSYHVTRSMEIDHKNLEITAYVERGRMTKDQLSDCVDGAFALCREYTDKYFDEESTTSELGGMLDQQRKSGAGSYVLSPSSLVLVRAGLALTDFSNGTYDMTAGALYHLYAEPDSEPTEEEIQRALSSCGTSRVTIDGNEVRLDSGVQLNLQDLADGYMCRMLEEYFVVCGISNVCIKYGDVVFANGGRLIPKGFLFWGSIEVQPFTVIIPDAYPDPNEDKQELLDAYCAWAARPQAAQANANYVDEVPFVSSKNGQPFDHDTGSVAVVLGNGTHAWYAHVVAHMFLSAGKDNAIKILRSNILETAFGLNIRYVRFESTSGETTVYDRLEEN